MGAGRRCEFCSSSRASSLLDGVLIKLDQNTPNLFRRNVRLIQLGINRHKNDVCGRLEVVDYAIARTFAFLNITVPHPHLEYSVARPGNLVAHDLTQPEVGQSSAERHSECAGTSWQAPAGYA